MLGAIIGDMVGSKYEFNPIKTKDFDIFDQDFRMTDDSLLTLAVAETLMDFYPIDYSDKKLEELKEELIYNFLVAFNKNRGVGFGGRFYSWCAHGGGEPYNSCGNGSAMRVSPVGWVANSEEEVKKLSKAVSEITHNHPEGIKGAEAVAMCIYLARNGHTKEEIKNRVIRDYYPEVANFNFEDLVKNYKFSEICQKSCPQAIYCFLISDSLEDAIRNCVAIGGDCDTTGAMAGAIAEAYYCKDSLSEFEDKFLYLCVDPDVEFKIKDFYNKIEKRKFIERRR